MPRIGIFVSYSGDGGVEKMVSNLARGFLQAGHQVDMVLIKARGAHLGSIPPEARVIDLQAGSTLLSLPGLIKYLRQENPQALLAAKERAAKVALLARRMTGRPEKLLLRLGIHLSQSLQGKSALHRALRYYPARWLYPGADRIICVSQGIAQDLAGICRLPASRFRAIPNPVLTPEIYQLAEQQPEDPWLSSSGCSRILAAGRLTRQKGFDVLLQAFARLCTQQPCRLLILGEGPLRPQLQKQIQDLGLKDLVQMPGFRANPYAYMARADLFVLSSRFEGSPNSLKEALALGTPVVATDCNSGPRQILQDGRFGPLVQVDDPYGLALAMQDTLRCPLPGQELASAVAHYTLLASSQAYLQEMGLETAVTSRPSD
ncbi:MAG: glycosyltransferase [Desulfohalobiaceae bacterium]